MVVHIHPIRGRARDVFTSASAIILITPVATRGAVAATDEFVEIYNASDKALTVSGVRLQYQATTCSGWYDRFVVPEGAVLAPGQFFLAAHPSGYLAGVSGPAPDGRLSASGLADSGFLRLTTGAYAKLDGMAYGVGHVCASEGAPAAAHAAQPGGSIARRPFDADQAYAPATPARDTDDGSVDFALRPARAPRSRATPAQPSR